MECLENLFKFGDDYAQWLAENAEYLNQGSMLLLSDLRPDGHDEVRFSTAVALTAMDLKGFRQTVKGITCGLSKAKRELLADGVKSANELGRLLCRDGFNTVVSNIRKMELNESLQTELRGKPLDMWVDLFKSQKTKAEIADEQSLQ